MALAKMSGLRQRQTPQTQINPLTTATHAIGNTEPFFVPDTSPMIVYGDGQTSRWTVGYAAQSDGYDQTLHVVGERERIGFRVEATTLTLLVPSFPNCSATISINASSPTSACATSSAQGDIPFSLYNLPSGLHDVEWDSGVIAPGGQVVFWGVEGQKLGKEGMVNVTMDDTYGSNGKTGGGSKDVDVGLEYTGDWEMASGGDGNFNKTLAVAQTTGASMVFKGKGSAVYLYGTIGPDHGSASISLNGETVHSRMNLTSPWTIPYQLLWFGTGYDPSSPFKVEMKSLEDRKMTLDFVVLSTDSTTLASLKTISTGSSDFLSTLAGKLVVFLLVPLITCTAIVTAFFLCVRRRRSIATTKRQSWTSDIYIRPNAEKHTSSGAWSGHSEPSIQDVFVSYDEGREQRLSDRWASSPSSIRSDTSRQCRTAQSRPQGQIILPHDTPAGASRRTLPALSEELSMSGSPTERGTAESWTRPLRSLLGSNYTRSIVDHSPRRETNLPPYTPGDNGTYLSTSSSASNTEAGAQAGASTSSESYATAEAEKALLYILAHVGQGSNDSKSSLEREINPSSGYTRAGPSYAERASTIVPSEVLSIFGQPPSEHRDSAMTGYSHLHHMFGSSPVPPSPPVPSVLPVRPRVNTDLTSLRHASGPASAISSVPAHSAMRLLRTPGRSPGKSASDDEWEERRLREISVVSGGSGRSAARPDSDVIPFETFVSARHGDVGK